MSVKLYWKVEPEPTGRYRSFARRGWPSAYYVTGGVRTDTEKLKPAAFLVCDDDYDPPKVRTGQHRPIEIIVLHHQHPQAGNSWKRFRLKETGDTLDRAKQIVQKFLDEHPEFHPKEESK